MSANGHFSAPSVVTRQIPTRRQPTAASSSDMSPNAISLHPVRPGARCILVVDDDATVLEALSVLLRDSGYTVICATNASAAMTVLKREDVDAALVDMNFDRDTTSGAEGVALLKRLRGQYPSLPIVMMTAWGDIELAVKSVQNGAQDFITKPWVERRLLELLATLTGGAGNRVSQSLRESPRFECHPPTPVSPSMTQVLDTIDKVASSMASVLILGEHGTGKEHTARQIHARSDRASRPFVVADLGAIAAGTFESELFGHVAGAFTDAKGTRVGRIEMANHGTLFLDEIANISTSQQARLLRVLQSGQLERVGSSHTENTDVRVISATNAHLDRYIEEGRFREDLLFRLNTIVLQLPPLRHRIADIMPLAEYFLSVYSRKYSRPTQSFSKLTSEALCAHNWPGNVRELAHTVERAVLLSDSGTIHPQSLSLRATPQDFSVRSTLSSSSSSTLEFAERQAVESALKLTGNNVVQAARLLGLSRGALYRRIHRFGL
jgi:DNA-binding NtrC family response regulator